MRIALSTGGGDAPGLNAVIRAAVLSATRRGWEVFGIKRGLAGLLGEDDVIALTPERVRGIGHTGGTILGTTNRGNPFSYPKQSKEQPARQEDRSNQVLSRASELGIEAVIFIGGDGTLTIAQELYTRGMKVIGVPKTIDNDVAGTLTTFGFDTAVTTAIEAIDKLHTTAESHDRVMVIEVMGRHAGFIALHSGVAGSADVILIPEIPYRLDGVCAKILERDRSGKRFSIVVVAEGAFSEGGSLIMRESAAGKSQERLGGIADHVAAAIQAQTGKETRSLVLGHLQRGGMPTGYDRLLATRFGAAAIKAAAEGRWGEMVALQPPTIVTVPIAEVLQAPKRVDLQSDIVFAARAIGISFGD